MKGFKVIISGDKTKPKSLGSMKTPNDNLFGFNWLSQDMYHLWVIITDREEDHNLLNFKTRLKYLENLLNSWKGVSINKGKLTVINILTLLPV